MSRRLALTTLGLCLALAVILGWSALRAGQVRTDLTAAQRTAVRVQDQLSTGNTEGARLGLLELRARVERAERRTRGPVWSVAQQLPLLGNNLRAVRRTARSAKVLGTEVFPEALSALDLVQARKPLNDGRVDFTVLAEIERHVDRAAAGSRKARALLASHDGLLLGPVRTKVAQVSAAVVALDDAVQSVARALRLAPGMLGNNEPRRYFLAVQNNAEARATGGLVGVFALLVADRGVIRLERVGTDAELKSASTPVPIDPAAARFWQRIGSTVAWFDSNLSPHFPDVGRTMAGLWRAQAGEHVDGVIALDPLVMGELLQTTGPVRLFDGITITADNVMDFVGRDQYVRYADNVQRKRLLAGLAAELLRHALAAQDPLGTLHALGRAAGSGHLFVWSATPQEQQLLVRGLVGGALPPDDTPWLSVLTQNFGGNKLDFYLRRAVTVNRQRDGLLRVQVVLRNTAPIGLPEYMTVRSDRPQVPVPYGQAKVGLSIYGARSSQVASVEVDGRAAPTAFDRDHGANVGHLTVEVPRGRSVVVEVTLSQPPGEFTYRQQPLVVPDELHIHVPHRVVGR